MPDRSVHEIVRSGYGRVAERDAPEVAERTSRRLGYSEEDVSGVAAVGNLGLGCGNPGALAELREGETVVDLGSGAGFDALLAAPKLGPTGRFIGVDMTPSMLERARTNAVNAGFARTVEFREGLIEDLPIASGCADVVISNCVINLSPDKARVFGEAFRVLKSGGRLAVTDIVLSEPLPAEVARSGSAWVGCVAGALVENEYLGHIHAAGFREVTFTRTPASGMLESCSCDPIMQEALRDIGPERIAELAKSVFSYSISARKP